MSYLIIANILVLLSNIILFFIFLYIISMNKNSTFTFSWTNRNIEIVTDKDGNVYIEHKQNDTVTKYNCHGDAIWTSSSLEPIYNIVVDSEGNICPK